MLEWLESVVKFLVLPPASLLLLYAVGLAAGLWRPRLGAWLRHSAFGLAFFLCTGVGSWLLVHPLESLEQPLTRVPDDAQAIVVLSAGRIKHNPEYANLAMPDFIALERMVYAASLARNTHLPILVTGGRLSTSADDEALALGMRRVFAASFGLPVRWVEAASRTTAENASLSAPLLQRDGVSRIVLVTDAMHMRRARRQFERAGLKVIPAPTFFNESGRLGWSDLLPTMENFRRSYYAIYEWLGLLRDLMVAL